MNARNNRTAALVALVVLTLAGTSAAAGAHPQQLPVSSADGAPALAATFEWFEGTVDEFYVVPDPLPPGEPGELIRVQAVSSTVATTTVRIMYHSRDSIDRDRAVTGMLTYPNAPAPEGGWPVISHANGTVGLASRCAPSRAGRPVDAVGFQAVAVASDYIGSGPVGERQAYLSRMSEGHSVIDAVRAARHLPEAGAGHRWMAIGGSQGGHGSLAANELGAAYAPELELLGTVSLAPAAMLDRVYGGLDPFVTRVVGAMALYGIATDHPALDPDDYLTPEGKAIEGVFDTGCTTEVASAVLSVPFDGYYARDPLVTEPARSIVLANDVGNVAVASPVFLIQGTADPTVVPERTRDLYERLCGVGQSTRYLEVEGADHGNVGARARTDIRAWMGDRLAGLPPRSSCPGEQSPFTARYPQHVCDTFARLEAATGIEAAELVRIGVDAFATVPTSTPTPPPGPPVEDACEIEVAWPDDRVPTVQATARAWAVTPDELHRAGGYLSLAVILWLGHHG